MSKMTPSKASLPTLRRLAVVYALAFLVLMSATLSGRSQATVCMPRAAFDTGLPTNWRAEWLSGKALAEAAELYNSFPPESQDVIDIAVMVHRPDGGGFLGVGNNGAVCNAINFSAQHWQALVRSIRGIEA